MAQYVTKHEIVKAVRSPKIDTNTYLPLLAFNNEEQTINCENCENRNATAFKYNASAYAGTDTVVFRWEPDLNRLVVRGHYCNECNWHEIYFKYPKIGDSQRENDPMKIQNVELGKEELVSHNNGD